MSDRLSELKRQRQLLVEHLQWLDKEIQEASGSAPQDESLIRDVSSPQSLSPNKDLPLSTPSLPAQDSSTSSADESPTPQEEIDPEAEQIISSYRSSPKNQAKSAQQGCLVFAVSAFLILCAIVFAVYWFAYRKTDENAQESASSSKTIQKSDPQGFYQTPGL